MWANSHEVKKQRGKKSRVNRENTASHADRQWRSRREGMSELWCAICLFALPWTYVFPNRAFRRLRLPSCRSVGGTRASWSPPCESSSNQKYTEERDRVAEKKRARTKFLKPRAWNKRPRNEQTLKEKAIRRKLLLCRFDNCAASRVAPHLARFGVSFEDLGVVVLELVWPLLLRPRMDAGVLCARVHQQQQQQQHAAK